MLGSLYYEANNIGSICCFVVAEPYRRQGVATRLLHAACDRFARMGLAYAEAYPSKGGPSERHYHGPLTIYLDAGFGTPSFRRPGPFYLLAIP